MCTNAFFICLLMKSTIGKELIRANCSFCKVWNESEFLHKTPWVHYCDLKWNTMWNLWKIFMKWIFSLFFIILHFLRLWISIICTFYHRFINWSNYQHIFIFTIYIFFRSWDLFALMWIFFSFTFPFVV